MKRIAIFILVSTFAPVAWAQQNPAGRRGECGELQGTSGTLYSQTVRSGETSYQTCFGWDNQGNLSSVVDSAGFLTTLEFDLLGRLLTSMDPIGEETQHHYTSRSQIYDFIQSNRSYPGSGPSNRRLEFGYDSIGSITSRQTSGMVGGRSTLGDSAQTFLTGDEMAKGVRGPDRALGSSMGYNFYGFLESTGVGVLNDEGEMAESLLGRNQYEYDAVGRLDAVIDGAARRTTFDYDEFGRLSEIRFPNNASVFTRYDDAGRARVRESRDHGGAALSRTEMDYDAMDRLWETRTYRPGINVVWKTRWNYADNGLTATAQYLLNDTLYAEEVKHFDPLGRIVSRELPGAGSNVWDYDTAGRLEQISHSATGLMRSYRYDSLGRADVVLDGLGNATSFRYDGLGNLAVSTDPEGTQTHRHFDPNGRPVDSLTGPIQMAHLYDAAGRFRGTNFGEGFPGVLNTYQRETGLLASAAIGDRVVYQVLERYEDGKVRRASDANGTGFHFFYDAVGQLIQIAAQKQSGELQYRNFSYYYDGRLKAVGESVEIPADGFSEMRGFGNHSYNIVTRALYRALGQPTYDQRLKSVVQFSYDAAGNLTEESRWIQGTWRRTRIGRSATGSGLWTTHVYPSGFRMERREDSASRLNLAQGRQADGSFAAKAVFEYLPDSIQLDRIRFGADVAQERYSYDAAGRVTGIGISKGAGGGRQIARMDYKYSPNGVVIARQEEVVPTEGGSFVKSFAFGYDDLNRIVRWNAMEEGEFVGVVNNTALAPENIEALQRYEFTPRGERRLISTRDPEGALGLEYRLRTVRYQLREDGAPETGVRLSCGTTMGDQNPLCLPDPVDTGSFSFNPYASGNIGAVLFERVADEGNPAGPIYGYDPFGRLTVVGEPHNHRRTNYQYDGLGRLISRKVVDPDGNVFADQEFVWDGAFLSEVIDVPERNASGEIRWALQKITSYLYGFGASDLLASFSHDEQRTRYHHSHPDGSTFLLTDAAGAVTQWYRYSPFGETRVLDWIQNAETARELGDSKTLRLFGGALVDPLTGYYFLGSWYDPAHGHSLGGR